jgi:hypothetical protein
MATRLCPSCEEYPVPRQLVDAEVRIADLEGLLGSVTRQCAERSERIATLEAERDDAIVANAENVRFHTDRIATLEALLREARNELRRIDPERNRPTVKPAEFTDEEWATIEKDIEQFADVPTSEDEWARNARMAPLLERIRPEAIARRIDAALGEKP